MRAASPQHAAAAALGAWEWLQREEHVFGAFEITHYQPKERQNSVKIVHPKNGEEAWRPLFDETGEPLFRELMAELDAIKKTMLPARSCAPQDTQPTPLDHRAQGPAVPEKCRQGHCCGSRDPK